MRAAVIERYGEAPVLREVPDPEPAEGLTLVEGRATVLVLGASGVLGLIAVQAARIMGAKHVVAAGRDRGRLEQARERGADAIVELGPGKELTEAFRKASGGGVDVVIDPVWGEPAAAALEALNRFGRLVQIGQSAGAEATLTSS